MTEHTHYITHLPHNTRTTAKHRSFTIDDDVDGNDMDPNLEEPLRAKLRREPSRQGAKQHLHFISLKYIPSHQTCYKNSFA